MDRWALVVSDDENTSQQSRRGSSSSSTDTSDTSSSGSSGSLSEASSSSKSIVEVGPECQTLGREVIRIPELIDEDLDIFSNLPVTSQFIQSLANAPDGVDPISLAFDALVKLEREEWLLNPQVDEPPTLVKRPARTSKPAAAGGAEATRCSADSLSELRNHFLVPDDVEFLVPSPSDRASSPPEGYFTLYEVFFYDTYLWFPIPSVIFEFLDLYSIAISQLMPRSMRHLVGLIIRSYEEKIELTARHIDALVQFSTKNNHYFLSARVHRQVITDFPNKDTRWWRWFFYVRKSEASVCSEALHLVRSYHSPIGRVLSLLFDLDFVFFI